MTTDATSPSSPQPAADDRDDATFLGLRAPPGPTRRAFWRSPVRGPWLTSLLGVLLLALLVVIAATGFLSHQAYEPDLGRNAIVPADRDLDVVPFDWPTSPQWLYALNQGLHVTVGIVAVPLLLAKLWSVIPRLFAWPPAASPAQALERLSVLLLVGSALFLFATGIANVEYWYPFGFNFVVGHYYAAWVMTGALALHVAIKTPVVLRARRTHGALAPLRASLAQTEPEPLDPDGLVPSHPQPPSVSRRGVLGLVGAASGALLVTTAGQSLGGPLRRLAVFAPRGRDTDFPVNKTAQGAGVVEAARSPQWRLVLAGGPEEVVLSRADLLAMEQRTERLTIGCVEGWSTTQTWTGVPLRALAERAGVDRPGRVTAVSIQEAVLGQATYSRRQAADERALLALAVDGEDLWLDHGFPARMMVPGVPGVHQTKWVRRLEFA